MNKKPRVSPASLFAGLLDDIERAGDHTIRRIVIGASLVAVEAARVGLCSNLGGVLQGVPLDIPEGPQGLVGQSARETARRLLRPGASLTAASLGLATVNALLFPPKDAVPAKAQDLILRHGRGKRVAVAGHFPFVERMGPSFLEFSVLEKNPRPGDMDLSRAPEVFGRADLAALTAQTVANGDLAGILSLLPAAATVMLIGPSAPFAPSLFAAGVDVIAGCQAEDPEAVLSGVAAGAPFKGLSGALGLVMEK